MRLSEAIADRPRHDLERSPLHRILDMAAWVLAVSSALLLFYYWPDLPDSVPIHFNAAGEPDGWGGPLFLWSLPAMSLILVAGLSWMERFPHRYNYLWPITEENAEVQYRLARELIAGLKAVCALLFLSIVWLSSELAMGRVVPNVAWVLLLEMGLLFAVIIAYFVRAAKAR